MTQAKKKPVPKKQTAKKATQKPKFEVKPLEEYVVGTEDYMNLIDEFNRLKGTYWLRARVRPNVFYEIHKELLEYYGHE